MRMWIKSSTTFTILKAFGHDGNNMWMQGPAKEYSSVFGSLEISDTISWGGHPTYLKSQY